MSDEANQEKEDRLRAEVAALRELLAGHERAARDSADRLELVEAELRQRQEEVARLQRDLREREERTRVLVDTSHDAVVTMDAQGRVTGWNCAGRGPVRLVRDGGPRAPALHLSDSPPAPRGPRAGAANLPGHRRRAGLEPAHRDHGLAPRRPGIPRGTIDLAGRRRRHLPLRRLHPGPDGPEGGGGGPAPADRLGETASGGRDRRQPGAQHRARAPDRGRPGLRLHRLAGRPRLRPGRRRNGRPGAHAHLALRPAATVRALSPGDRGDPAAPRASACPAASWPRGRRHGSWT